MHVHKQRGCYCILLHVLYLQSEIRQQLTNIQGQTYIGIRPIDSRLHVVNSSSLSYQLCPLLFVIACGRFVICFYR